MRKINNGFTLIELLIAASIAAVLGLAIVATFAAGFKTYSKLKDNSLAQADVLLSFGKIEKDLRNTFHFSGINFTGDTRSISFAGYIDRNFSIGRISYLFNTNGGSLIKTKQPYSYALLDNSTEDVDSKIIVSLKNMVFSYYYLNSMTNQYGWYDSFDTPGGVPMQVRIKAVFQEGNEDFEQEKTIFIPISG